MIAIIVVLVATVLGFDRWGRNARVSIEMDQRMDQMQSSRMEQWNPLVEKGCVYVHTFEIREAIFRVTIEPRWCKAKKIAMYTFNDGEFSTYIQGKALIIVTEKLPALACTFPWPADGGSCIVI